MQNNNFFSLEQVIDRQTLTVSPKTLLSEVIRLMQEWPNICYLDENDGTSDSIALANNSCALVIEEEKLRGIFTEQDLVRLIATGKDFAGVAVSEVMSRELITLTATGKEDIFTAINLIRQHGARHLPVIDENDRLLGLITIKNLRRNLQPINLMKWPRVEEIMETNTIHALPSLSIRQAANLMTEHQVSYIAIVELDRDLGELLIPVGIITERDIVQLKALDLDLAQPVRKFMSAPLFLVSPEDTLWSAHQQMQQHRVRRLLVAGEQGELQGIVTQLSLLQIFDPTEIYGIIETLKRKVGQLEIEKTEYLENRNRELEQEVQNRTAVVETKNQELQRIQAELQKINQELSYHINNTPLAVIKWDHNFCVQRWSKRAEQMFGWQEAEVLGKNWNDWQFALEQDLERVQEITTLLLEGIEPRNISYNRNYTKSGLVIDCKWYSSVLLDESGNLVSILSFVQDDSDHHKALHSRQQAESKLEIQAIQQRAIAELGQYALEGKSLVSLMERSVNLVASTLEVEYCKVLELLPDGKNLLLKAGVGWREGLVGKATVRADINSQAGYTIFRSEPVVVENLLAETRFSGPNLLLDHQVISGISVIIAGNDKPFGILGTHTTQQRNFSQDDVDFIQAIANILAQAIKRKQTEIQLQESEERYELAVKGSRDGLWDWNIFTNEVIFSPRFKEIIGYTDAEMPNVLESWTSKLHPEDRSRVLEALAEHLEQRIPYNIEYRLRTKQGNYCWTYARGQAIWDKNGVPTRMAGSLTDISDRQEKEAELKKQALIFGSIYDGVILTDPQGRIIDWNPSAERMFGYNKSEVLGQTPGIIHKPEEPAILTQQILEGMSENGSWTGEINFVCKDGTEGICATIVVPQYNEQGELENTIGVNRDITDRKRREEILKDIASGVSVEIGENFLPSLVEYLSKVLKVDYAFVAELIQPNANSLNTLAVYSKGEIIDNFEYLISDTLCQEVVGKELCIYPNAVRQLFPNNLMLREMGAESYAGIPIFKSTGTAFGLIVIIDSKPFADITLIEEVLKIFATRAMAELERRQAEITLRQSEQKFKWIFNQTFQFMGLLKPDGTVIEANQNSLDFIGMTLADVVDKPFWKTAWWSLSVEIQEQLKDAIAKAAKGELIRYEVDHQGVDGRVITVDFSLKPLKDETGKIVMLIPESRDITEQKQLEAQFLRTQRLESLGTLAGGIAHDLNNILAPILGFAQLLPLKLPDLDQQTQAYFQIIKNNAQRGTALVKQILTFARGLEGDRGTLQIRHLIIEIKQIIAETFPKSIELEISVPKNLWTINGDMNQLHQVLMNLVVNARDAMPYGGKLIIEAQNYLVNENYARRYLDARVGSYVLLSVRDTGVGISPEIIERIFEPFFTTKEVGQGTGLGLSTVIGIIKSHDGFVDITSSTVGETRGTEVKVFLPASGIAITATEEIEEIPQGNGELILVVDDEQSILEVSKATLKSYNYKVLTASNGIEAIALYVQNQNSIDMIIMDIMMPIMDGKTAIMTLNQINSEVKILAVSGLISSQDIATEIDSNIVSFIAKPYTNEKLLREIYEIVSC